VGVVPDPARARVEFAKDGARDVLEVAANPMDLNQLWGRPELPARAGVTWLEGREQTWRLQVCETERALYVQYNEVRAQAADGRSLEHFARELVETFEQKKLDKLIVDVRSNGGGDNTTFGPLIAALQSPSINRANVLFGLIGRGTFSAAGNFVTVLERDTKVILLGEPTGGAPNQYGDAETVPLPNHPDVLVRISTRYHQFAPGDARITHEPLFPVPLTSQDYFAGRDPVLQAALTYQPSR
jgi:C-terminal processing protease CtpA/Prc